MRRLSYSCQPAVLETLCYEDHLLLRPTLVGKQKQEFRQSENIHLICLFVKPAGVGHLCRCEGAHVTLIGV